MANLKKNAPKLGTGVLARYGNFFRGDDDFFTHCLILKNGECWLLGQGLQEVHVHVFKANAADFHQLQSHLTTIPAAWPSSSYNGYNFITDVENSAVRNEVAVYGLQPGNTLSGYFVPPSSSSVETLVKTIANID